MGHLQSPASYPLRLFRGIVNWMMMMMMVMMMMMMMMMIIIILNATIYDFCQCLSLGVYHMKNMSGMHGLRILLSAIFANNYHIATSFT